MPLRWMSLCWMSLWLVSLCWVLLCWMSSCWELLCEIHYAECHYVECCYAQRHCAECRGTNCETACHRETVAFACHDKKQIRLFINFVMSHKVKYTQAQNENEGEREKKVKFMTSLFCLPPWQRPSKGAQTLVQMTLKVMPFYIFTQSRVVKNRNTVKNHFMLSVVALWVDVLSVIMLNVLTLCVI